MFLYERDFIYFEELDSDVAVYIVDFEDESKYFCTGEIQEFDNEVDALQYATQIIIEKFEDAKSLHEKIKEATLQELREIMQIAEEMQEMYDRFLRDFDKNGWHKNTAIELFRAARKREREIVGKYVKYSK